ncbi:MAG: hypothetical protein RR495_06045 [Anaerovoracaceae bacterium]
MLRIWICDDDNRDIEKLEQLLMEYSYDKDINFDILKYSCGANFLMEYTYNEKQIVFLDMIMVDINGIAVGKSIRKADNDSTINFGRLNTVNTRTML